jgi:hypothetical protein
MIRHLTSHLAITPTPGAGKTIQAQLPCWRGPVAPGPMRPEEQADLRSR